ncbi:hypothetical protein [Halarchaeum nitratireducens]|uniref:MarR family transcriptional regulator n=1 Tax=Halarchaeum nitratireducens TaxID=489913 RepID=A0A830GBB8_9EURY|nr:hypothetical protein [Halarchaeum nitratireducens]GGN14995.1 hypothetical protein GCM10009021_14140 [Halarchaeum nitratireducens]
MSGTVQLSCHAKLARVVLDNRGPLSPAEVASEARIDEDEAHDALAELAEAGYAECVCGVCETREQVYQLDEDARDVDARA